MGRHFRQQKVGIDRAKDKPKIKVWNVDEQRFEFVEKVDPPKRKRGRPRKVKHDDFGNPQG